MHGPVASRTNTARNKSPMSRLKSPTALKSPSNVKSPSSYFAAQVNKEDADNL